jgi:hypothetical protein
MGGCNRLAERIPPQLALTPNVPPVFQLMLHYGGGQVASLSLDSAVLQACQVLRSAAAAVADATLASAVPAATPGVTMSAAVVVAAGIQSKAAASLVASAAEETHKDAFVFLRSFVAQTIMPDATAPSPALLLQQYKRKPGSLAHVAPPLTLNAPPAGSPRFLFVAAFSAMTVVASALAPAGSSAADATLAMEARALLENIVRHLCLLSVMPAAFVAWC